MAEPVYDLLPFEVDGDLAPMPFTCYLCKREIGGDEARYIRLVLPYPIRVPGIQTTTGYRSPWPFRQHFLNHE